MDKKEAQKIIKKHLNDDNPSKDDEFAFIEACNFLIETENDPDAMVHLGGYYYAKEKYHLAEKYYLMADENGNDWAADGLGFIYYYGRAGERDFKKAMYYFSIAKNRGNLEAAMKIADMYHHGYGVTKDETKYKALLLEIYEKIKGTNKLFDPYPEVAHRLGEILIKEGGGKKLSPYFIKVKHSSNKELDMILSGVILSFVDARLIYFTKSLASMKMNSISSIYFTSSLNRTKLD